MASWILLLLLGATAVPAGAAKLRASRLRRADTQATAGPHYFLAPGGQSCDQACKAKGEGWTCNAVGLKQAVATIAECKAIINKLGKTPAKGGTYRDDNSGCTYNPGQTGWYQIMRKDADPECAAVNPDPKRQRVCTCTPPLPKGGAPKVGVQARVITDNAVYQRMLDEQGLMRVLEMGKKGTIKELDLPAGQALVKLLPPAVDEEGWVPIRCLEEYKDWCPPGMGCPTTTTVAPGAPATTTLAIAAGPAAAPAETTTTEKQRLFGKTDYTFSSCRVTDEEVENPMTSPLGMSSTACFQHCHKAVGMHYFAMSGTSCYCSALLMGREVSSDKCDSKCMGNPAENCGGAGFAASVYTMIDCDPPTPVEKLQEEADAATELIGLFSKFDGESCDQSKELLTEVGGSTTMAGTADDCKVACWNKKGGNTCHGFTYDSVQSKCTFHSDVVHDAVEKKATLTCYWKKVGYKL